MATIEELRILRTEVEADVTVVERLAQNLNETRSRLPQDPTPEQLAHLGYLLHGIYTEWESAWHRIATTFENRLDPARWHEQLLRRMTLAIPRIRPTVLPPDLAEHLTALRSFRHFFRYSYAAPLRWNRMQPALEALDACVPSVQDSLRGFLTEVERIADHSEESAS